MTDILKNPVLSYVLVKSLVNEFKRGRENLDDECYSRRPVTVSTEEIVVKIYDMILEDRQCSVTDVADNTGISAERVHSIIRDTLEMTTVLAGWFFKLLTLDQKRDRTVTCERNLAPSEADPEGFLKRFVTRDEIWVHHFTPKKIKSVKRMKTSCFFLS